MNREVFLSILAMDSYQHYVTVHFFLGFPAAWQQGLPVGHFKALGNMVRMAGEVGASEAAHAAWIWRRRLRVKLMHWHRNTAGVAMLRMRVRGHPDQPREN
jgi:hypothetical protein